jgi:hypothetical protein
MLIQKFDDRILAEVDFKALYLCLDLLRRKPLLDVNAPQRRDDMRR